MSFYISIHQVCRQYQCETYSILWIELAFVPLVVVRVPKQTYRRGYTTSIHCIRFIRSDCIALEGPMELAPFDFDSYPMKSGQVLG